INSAILSIKSEILPLFITSYFLLITSYSLLLTPYSAYTLNLDAFALGTNKPKAITLEDCSIRLLGLSLSNLDNGINQAIQLSLFES
ncbi:MAG: hypothetical protein ACFB2X_25290, partial [Rivularia sp. (in: cyanobacteria)]